MAKGASTAAPAARRKRKGQSAADRVGERVASYRKDRHLKVSELARMVGVSPSLISQIERGQSQPSVATLFALAESLDVPVDAFFLKEGNSAAAAEPRPQARDGRVAEPEAPRAAATPAQRYLVRRDARAAINIEGGVLWERLTPETLPHVDFLELIYQPGAESNPELYRHPGTEMVLVLSGRFDIYVGFERYELNAGDSIHFPSSFPHRYVNPTDEVSRAVTVILHDGEREPADRGGPASTVSTRRRRRDRHGGARVRRAARADRASGSRASTRIRPARGPDLRRLLHRREDLPRPHALQRPARAPACPRARDLRAGRPHRPAALEPGTVVVVYHLWPCRRCGRCRAGIEQQCQNPQGWTGFMSPGGFQQRLVAPIDRLTRGPAGDRPGPRGAPDLRVGTSYRAVITRGGVRPGARRS